MKSEPVTRRWVLAAIGPLAVSGVLVQFRDQFAPPNAALVLVLVVLATAMIGCRVGPWWHGERQQSLAAGA